MTKKIFLFFVCILFAFQYECKAQNVKTFMKWKIVEQVDEFGDPIGGSVLSYETKGTFSNNTVATKNSATVLVMFTKEYGVLFQFFEYGKYYASLYTDLNAPLSVKTKSGNVTKFFMVPRSKGRIFPMPISDVTRKWGYEDFSLFIDMLIKETTIKCVFSDVKGKSFSFSIDCRGFTKAFEAFLKDNDLTKIKILDEDFLYDHWDE